MREYILSHSRPVFIGFSPISRLRSPLTSVCEYGASMIAFGPTLGLANSLSFHHLKNGAKDFPVVRVWGEVKTPLFELAFGFVQATPGVSTILLGMSTTARTLVVVHRYRENESVVRIFSVRKATKKEVRFYEDGM